MNWWLWLQLGQWLTQLPAFAPYQLSDEAFFASSPPQQQITLAQPDTLLLDMALFQATNEARRRAGLLPLRYDWRLHQAASRHVESMMRYDYTSHEDYYQLDQRTLLTRVRKQTARFHTLAENIGRYQTIDTPEYYAVRWDAAHLRYMYLDPANRQPCVPFTYAAYARYAVEQWLASPHHRANLLNPAFTHVGCAARLSARPYAQNKSPFGRVIQDFGTE